MEGEPKFTDFNEAGIEKPKFHYAYTDNSQKTHPIIFSCEANDVTEANLKFKDEFGYDFNDLDKNIGRCQL